LTKLAQAAGAPLRRLEASVANQTWAAIADLRTCFPETHPGAILLRASLPLSAFEEFIGRAEREAESEKMRLATLGQPGVGIIHILLPGASRAERLVPLIGRLRLAAGTVGGILVAERCPVELKAGIDVWGAPGDDFEVMRKLKAAWDPKGVLAPGRYLGGI
jgi:glycolate oxidase FAD binding subunit